MNMRNIIIALVIMAGWSVTARPAGTPTKENATSGYSAATSEDPDVTAISQHSLILTRNRKTSGKNS